MDGAEQDPARRGQRKEMTKSDIKKSITDVVQQKHQNKKHKELQSHLKKRKMEP